MDTLSRMRMKLFCAVVRACVMKGCGWWMSAGECPRRMQVTCMGMAILLIISGQFTFILSKAKWELTNLIFKGPTDEPTDESDSWPSISTWEGAIFVHSSSCFTAFATRSVPCGIVWCVWTTKDQIWHLFSSFYLLSLRSFIFFSVVDFWPGFDPVLT